MTTDTLIIELAKYRTRLVSEEERLRSELECVHARMEAADLILGGHEWEDGGVTPEVGTTDGPPTALTAQDITDCPNIMAGLRKVAEMSGGYLRVRITARLLMDSGLSRSATIGSASASIYQRLRNNEDWELYETGLFRYLPYFAAQTEAELENSAMTLLACPDSFSGGGTVDPS